MMILSLAYEQKILCDATCCVYQLHLSDSVYAWLQTLVLEGAKIEANDTDDSNVGNGYTRY